MADRRAEIKKPHGVRSTPRTALWTLSDMTDT
jgi:hypothetical protein